MKTVIAVLAGLLLTGCAGMGERMHNAANSINHGVARAPDATVDVRVKQ